MTLRAAAVAAGVLALAACGSSGPSREEYAKRGNEVCRDARKQVNALPKVKQPTLEDLQEQTPEARRVVRRWTEVGKRADEIGREAQRELLELDAPEDFGQRRERLEEDLEQLEQAGKDANAAGEKVRRAARSGDEDAITEATEAAARISRRQQRILLRLQEHFVAFGWTACNQTR